MAITVGERFGWTNPYLGFDIAPADIEFATRAITSIHPGFVFRHLDVRNDYYNPRGRVAAGRARFPAADATFDFAFATSVFTHFFTAELRRYLAEAHRCLAPGGAFLSSWFLLDAVSRAGMREPGSRLDFRHRVDEHALAHNPRKPGKAVAYATEFVRTALLEAGFADVVHHRGTWSGTPGRHSQDVVVARRA